MFLGLCVQRVDVFALSPSQRQAFFINIYNVLVIHAIALYGHPPTAAKRWVFFSYVRSQCTLGGGAGM